jgi:hypothetical protein
VDRGGWRLELDIRHTSELPSVRVALRRLAAYSDVPADSVVLAANELAINALRYTTGPCRLLGWNPPPNGPLRIEVSDPSQVPLPPIVATGATSVSGWGLNIVDQVVSRWGHDVHPLGKTVWFEIDPHAR